MPRVMDATSVCTLCDCMKLICVRWYQGNLCLGRDGRLARDYGAVRDSGSQTMFVYIVHRSSSENYVFNLHINCFEESMHWYVTYLDQGYFILIGGSINCRVLLVDTLSRFSTSCYHGYRILCLYVCSLWCTVVGVVSALCSHL